MGGAILANGGLSGSDFGPVESWALARLASTCALVAIALRAYTQGCENPGVLICEIGVIR